MTLLLKVLACILMILIIALIVIYLVATKFGQKKLLKHEIGQPKLEMPVTYTIGWWAYQKNLTIDSLQVLIVENKTDLFNSKSIVSYQIEGHIKWDSSWQPTIKEVHISERIHTDTIQNFSRIIELTPVAEVKRSKKSDQGTEKFCFKNEHVITSLRWGENQIKFICGNKEQIIKLEQRNKHYCQNGSKNTRLNSFAPILANLIFPENYTLRVMEIAWVCRFSQFCCKKLKPVPI